MTIIDPAEHLDLAAHFARPYASSRPRLADDLHAVARLGLVVAARKYDPSQGVWSSFAYHWMRSAMAHFLAKEIPKGYRSYRRPDRAAAPRPRRLDGGPEPIAPGRPGGGGDEAFEALACRCKPREAEVLRLIYRDGLGTAEIGRRLGVTKQAISKRHARAIRHLRARLGVEAATGPVARRRGGAVSRDARGRADRVAGPVGDERGIP